MQVKRYPLPPLFLSEILEQAKADHTHRCDEYCADGEYGASHCRTGKADNEALLDEPVIVSIEEGNGRHVCDEECEELASRRRTRCMRHCEDSDWIVDVRYSSRGWRAVYGVKRAGDVQHVDLWMD